MERKAEHGIARKLKVLNHAKEHGNISKTCRYFRICRERSTYGDALTNQAATML